MAAGAPFPSRRLSPSRSSAYLTYYTVVIGRLDSNRKRTYHEPTLIEEAKMHPIAAHALRDVAEIAALGAFLVMIALIARAVGS
jgi:hypothetical protein